MSKENILCSCQKLSSCQWAHLTENLDNTELLLYCSMIHETSVVYNYVTNSEALLLEYFMQTLSGFVNKLLDWLGTKLSKKLMYTNFGKEVRNIFLHR